MLHSTDGTAAPLRGITRTVPDWFPAAAFVFETNPVRNTSNFNHFYYHSRLGKIV